MTRRQELVLATVGAFVVLVAATMLLIRPTRQATAEAQADRDAAVPGGGGTSERQVALVSIANGTAKVTVDGTPYSVSEGERFADDYRAVDINSECASFESSTTAFTLCEGEAVLK